MPVKPSEREAEYCARLECERPAHHGNLAGLAGRCGDAAHTVQAGAVTALAWESQEWEGAVHHFTAQVSRRRWGSRWWRRTQPAVSPPLMFPLFHAEGESCEHGDARRMPE